MTAFNTGGSSPASDEAMAEPFVSPAAPSVTPNYGYSSDGLRAWKQIGASPTYFLYDGSNPVCELDGSGTVLATNTWGGQLLSRRVGSASTFYTFDPSGNLAQRLDGAGNVLGAYAFDAFGLRTGTDSTTDPYAGFGGGWGYYADAETGLSLLGHRYYDTGTGRFITRDPIGYDGGIDLYSYTENNPINEMDPDGTDSVDNAIMAISVAYGGMEGGIAGGTLGGVGGTFLEPGGGTLVGGVAGVYAGAGIGAGIGAGVGGLAIALRHRVMDMAGGKDQTPRRQVGPPRPDAPDGQPRRIFRKCPTKGRAEDLARKNGNGPPEHDPAKINRDGEYEPGHYHSTRKVPGGHKKVPDGVHWQYPPFEME